MPETMHYYCHAGVLCFYLLSFSQQRFFLSFLFSRCLLNKQTVPTKKIIPGPPLLCRRLHYKFVTVFRRETNVTFTVFCCANLLTVVQFLVRFFVSKPCYSIINLPLENLGPIKIRYYSKIFKYVFRVNRLMQENIRKIRLFFNQKYNIFV